MYQVLLALHSVIRWLVLGGLLSAIYRGIQGYRRGKIFSKADNRIRHITATIAHVQLIIGYTLYFTSPLIIFFRSNFSEAKKEIDYLFFGLIHIILMTIALIVITIGSAISKRKSNDASKYLAMAVWYSIALLIIFIAIPWPFSPLAGRPLIRVF